MAVNMEILTENLVATTTQITVGSNTDTVSQLYDRFTTKGYTSSGFTASTATTISVVFASTQAVSRIFLQAHNLKDFDIYFDSNASNVFSLTGTPDTTTTDWSTNSATNHYLIFATTQIASLQIVMNTAITSGAEKGVGELYIGDLKHRLTKNPARAQYKTALNPKQIVHNMSDGGTKIFDIREKYRAQIGIEFVSTADRDTLRTIYNEKNELYFAPFPTGTSWDGTAYEVAWAGPFTGFRPSTNSPTEGYSIKMDLRETAN